MLIPVWLYDAVLVVLLAFGSIAALYFIYRPKIAKPVTRVPVATIVEPPRFDIWRWLPITALIGGLGGGYCFYDASHDVLIVRADGATHYKHIGTPRYPLAHDAARSDYANTWIVNDSLLAVRLETVSYGMTAWGQSAPTEIPTGLAIRTVSVDYVGPRDPPPSSIEASDIDAKLHFASRTWLTWR